MDILENHFVTLRSVVVCCSLVLAVTGCTGSVRSDEGAIKHQPEEWREIVGSIERDPSTGDSYADQRAIHRMFVEVYREAVTRVLTDLGVTHQEVSLVNQVNPVITGKPKDLSEIMVFQFAGSDYQCPDLPQDNTRMTALDCTVTVRIGGLSATNSEWNLEPKGHHGLRLRTRNHNTKFEYGFYEALNAELPSWTRVAEPTIESRKTHL